MEQKTVVLGDLVELVARRKVEGAAHYWYVAKDAYRAVCALKDKDGCFIVTPPAAGHLYELLGYPIEIAQDPTWCGIDFLAYPAYPTFAPTPTPDPINHPKHYTSHPSGIECIQITEHMGFNLGNAVKYVWRADLKHNDATEDLKKAKWYIDRELKKRGTSCL